MDSKLRNPNWWTDKHTSTWDRVKGALERDWEQTKNDMSSSSGRDLNQNVGDTVKQSTGSQPIPPINVKTRPDEGPSSKWSDAEPGIRYGYSVRSQYPANTAWNDELEGKIRTEWDTLGTGRSWQTSRTEIRRGWDYAGRMRGDKLEAA